jgi:hypothetical protein
MIKVMQRERLVLPQHLRLEIENFFNPFDGLKKPFDHRRGGRAVGCVCRLATHITILLLAALAARDRRERRGASARARWSARTFDKFNMRQVSGHG